MCWADKDIFTDWKWNLKLFPQFDPRIRRSKSEKFHFKEASNPIYDGITFSDLSIQIETLQIYPNQRSLEIQNSLFRGLFFEDFVIEYFNAS